MVWSNSKFPSEICCNNLQRSQQNAKVVFKKQHLNRIHFSLLQQQKADLHLHFTGLSRLWRLLPHTVRTLARGSLRGIGCRERTSRQKSCRDLRTKRKSCRKHRTHRSAQIYCCSSFSHFASLFCHNTNMGHLLVVSGRQTGQPSLQQSLGVWTLLTGKTGVECECCFKPGKEEN